MVCKCCVPYCKGNYKNAHKVHIFKFPNDVHLKKLWLKAIKREDFLPTKYSVVCHKHFTSHEIRWNTIFPTISGEEISLPLKIPRLIPGAIPSLLPKCPGNSNKSIFHRKNLREKTVRRANRGLQRVTRKKFLMDSQNSACLSSTQMDFKLTIKEESLLEGEVAEIKSESRRPAFLIVDNQLVHLESHIITDTQSDHSEIDPKIEIKEEPWWSEYDSAETNWNQKKILPQLTSSRMR